MFNEIVTHRNRLKKQARCSQSSFDFNKSRSIRHNKHDKNIPSVLITKSITEMQVNENGGLGYDNGPHYYS